MIATILLIALSAFSALSAQAAEPTYCANPNRANDSVQTLTNVAGRLVYELKRMGFSESPGSVYFHKSNFTRKLETYFYLKAPEKNVIGLDPTILVAVKNALELSKLADRFCKGKTQNQEDEWGDSVRHFVAAAALSAQLGPQKAQEFMDAHETGGGWGEKIGYFHATLNDLHNNAAGIEFGAKFFTKGNRYLDRTLNEEEAVLGAVLALMQGKLVSAKGGRYQRECAKLFEREKEVLREKSKVR